jgi:orotate phosphoribosyltransferase
MSGNPSDILETRLRDTGALLSGHFQLSSGLHSEQYVQCALLLQHPEHAGWAGQALAAAVGKHIDLVVGPALGGVITTGGSAREAALCVEQLGAVIAGYACLVDRGGAQHMGAPAHALLSLDVSAYAPSDCPACRAGSPVEKPGSRSSRSPGGQL